MCRNCASAMFTIVILSVFVYSVAGHIDCKDLFTTPIKNMNISDAYIGVIESLYVNDIEDAEIKDSKYINAIVKDSKLIISTTTDFNYYNGTKSFIVTASVKCTEAEYQVNYNITIEKPPCNEITFSQMYYSYMFYDVLLSSSELDLTESEEIMVKCVSGSPDFFIEENGYFALEYRDQFTWSDQYYATLQVLQNIYAPFKKNFTITAWDVENPNATTTALLMVEVINTDVITFTESLYYGYINSNFDVIINNGPIVLKSDVDLNDITIEVYPEYDTFFSVRYSTKEVILLLETEQDLSELIDERDSLLVTLTAYEGYSNSLIETSVMLNTSILRDIFHATIIPSVSVTDFDDSSTVQLTTNEETPAEEQVIVVNYPLREFDFWITNTKTLSIMMVIIAGVIILTSIVLLKIRMSSRKMLY